MKRFNIYKVVGQCLRYNKHLISISYYCHGGVLQWKFAQEVAGAEKEHQTQRKAGMEGKTFQRRWCFQLSFEGQRGLVDKEEGGVF